jgi:hypothetical protein
MIWHIQHVASVVGLGISTTVAAASICFSVHPVTSMLRIRRTMSDVAMIGLGRSSCSDIAMTSFYCGIFGGGRQGSDGGNNSHTLNAGELEGLVAG